MKGHEMLDIIENLDPEYIESAAAAPKVKKSVWLKKCSMIAACFVLLLSAGLGTYAYAAEVKEYNEAIKFFNDHALSTEGLTRGEIKKVYRDITTETFEYAKTAEVIEKSLTSEQTAGFEITQDNPTPEDIENLWNYMNYNGWFPTKTANGIHYEYSDEYTEEGPYGQLFFAKSYMEKYDGETLLWSVAVSEFSIQGFKEVSGGVIAYGESGVLSNSQRAAWIVKFNENGTILWKNKLNNGFRSEYIAEVLENGDGSYAVISRGDSNYFCLSQYTTDGELTHSNRTEVGNYGIWNAARFDDGYIVQLASNMTAEYAKIVKVDKEGNITESFSYSSEDKDYHITDMIEFNGKIYLSAYAVPKYEDPNGGARYEIAKILNYLFTNNIWEISDEELTPMVRENYTAILLVCDPDVGTPQEFYSVEGSLGGKLALSDSGNLLWDVESITTTFYSPATSSFTIGGTCYVFRYTFNGFGALVSQEKTEEITAYRR